MRFILLALALFCLSSAPASAAVNPSDAETVKKVEAYLNDISTLRAHFLQTAHDGKQAAGTFLLKRPGRMRFEYAPPVTDFIVADGTFVYYYDGQMKQQSYVPIGQSLADFFLRAKLTLAGDIRVTEVRRSGGMLHLTLVQAREPGAGSLTLILAENPLQLKKWRIVDAQGLTTEVELFDTETRIKLDSDLFHYYDPERGKKQNNLN